jgi:hypothetical protein
MAFPLMALGQASNEELRAELLEMGKLDQGVRERIMVLLRDAGPDALSSDELRALAQEQQQVDEKNFLRLEEIVREHGWPNAELVGEEANGVAWLLLQHANIDRQKRYLALLRPTVAGIKERASVAMLEDEIALAEDGKQIYGTEITLANGKAAVAPVADPAQIDARRAAVGLPPMEEYLRQAESELGMPVDRSALSVE